MKYLIICIFGGIQISGVYGFDSREEAMKEFQECKKRKQSNYDYYVWNMDANQQLAGHIYGQEDIDGE